MSSGQHIAACLDTRCTPVSNGTTTLRNVSAKHEAVFCHPSMHFQGHYCIDRRSTPGSAACKAPRKFMNVCNGAKARRRAPRSLQTSWCHKSRSLRSQNPPAHSTVFRVATLLQSTGVGVFAARCEALPQVINVKDKEHVARLSNFQVRACILLNAALYKSIKVLHFWHSNCQHILTRQSTVHKISKACGKNHTYINADMQQSAESV